MRLNQIDDMLSQLAEAVVAPKKMTELRGGNIGAQIAAIKGKAYHRGKNRNDADPRSGPRKYDTTDNDEYWKKFRANDPEKKKHHFDPTKLNKPQRLVRRSGS